VSGARIGVTPELVTGYAVVKFDLKDVPLGPLNQWH
jgi:hypothetical protein